MTKSWQLATVVLIVLVAILVRLYRIDSPSVWYDEAVVLLFAGKSLGWIFEQIPRDTMPPLHYFLLHFWLGLGRQEGVVRLLSALFSTGAIPLTYLLAHRLFGQRVALMATLLAAISPFQVYFAQEARMYAQLSFFNLAAAYSFLRAWQGGGRLAWASFALSSAATAYTHNLGLLTLVILNVYALWGARGRWSGVWGQGSGAKDHAGRCQSDRLGLQDRVGLSTRAATPDPRPLTPSPRHWLAANGLVAVAYLPWLGTLWQQAGQIRESFWLAAPGPEAILTTLYSFVFAHTLADSLFAFGLFLVLFLVFLGLYLVVRRAGNRDRLMLFCLIMLFLPPLAAFLISFLRPIYLERALIGSSFFLYVFLAWTLLRLQPGWLRWFLGGALVAVMLAGLFNYYFAPSFARPPMREAALSLAGELRPGDAVLHTSDGSLLPFIFYDESSRREDRHRLVAGDPELAPGRVRRLALSILGLQDGKVEDLVAGKERVWLVVALDHSVDWQLSTKRWFDERFQLEAERDNRGIRVYLYSRLVPVVV